MTHSGTQNDQSYQTRMNNLSGLFSEKDPDKLKTNLNGKNEEELM